MSQFAASWLEARRRYTDIVGLDPDDAQFPHPSSVDTLLGVIEERSQSFADFRSRKGKLFHVLSEIGKPISIIASVAGDEAQMAFPAATVCFGAVSHLINAAKGVSSAYDNIVDLLEQLKALLIRLNVYENTIIPAPLHAHFIDMLVTLMEILAYSTKTIGKGIRERISRFAKNALLGEDETTSKLLARLEVLSKREDLLTGAVTLVSTQQILDSQRSLEQDIQGMQKMLETLSTAPHIQLDVQPQFNVAKSILRPSMIPDDILQAISKKRVPETGAWIRDQQSFNNWLDKKTSVLCIAGSPGFGKSFLAASTISFLQTRILQSDNGSVAYFFFKDANPQARKVDQCLRDLAYQTYQNDASFRAYFDSHFTSDNDISSPESIWREVFQKYFLRQKEAKTVYLILDGLDEAFQEDQETLFNILAPDPTFDTTSKIQILLTGRQHVFNELSLVTNEVFPIIHIDEFKNKQDITQYVNLSISKSRSLARFPKLQKEIAETLVSKSQGMFLWVDLMIRDLGHRTRADKVREALHKAPKGLNEMVQTVLENYSMMFDDEQEAGDFNTILTWVACAAVPLPLGVIDEVLRIRLFNEDGVSGLEERLRHEWGVLLDVKRTDGLSTDDLESNPIKLYKAMEVIYGDTDNCEEAKEELGIELTSNPDSTEINFCHASIGDIFRSGLQGKVSAGNCHPAVGVDISQAAMETLHECLKSVCTKPQNGTNDTPLRKYSINKWLDHVKLACKYIEGVETKLHEATGVTLLKLFQDESIMEDWLPKISTSEFNKTNLEYLLVIIKPCATAEYVPKDSRQWAETIVARPFELFLPSARFSAKQWLQGYTWKVDFCLQVIINVACLKNEHPVEKGLQGLSAKIILEVAESTGFQKNAEWHRRIAMSLLQLGYRQEAEEHFRAAMDLDSRNWLAPAGLGHVEKVRGQYQEALRLMILSSEILETILKESTLPTYQQKSDLARRYEDVAETALAAGDHELALRFFRKSLDLIKGRQNCMAHYLKALPTDDPAEIVRAFKTLDTKIPGSTLEYATYLRSFIYRNGDFLVGLMDYWKVAAAFKSEGEIKWLQNAYRALVAAAGKDRLPIQEFVLSITLADSFYVYDEKEENAMQIWRTVLRFPSTFLSSNKALKYQHAYVGKNYAQCLLKNAFRSGMGTEDAEKYIQLLEEFCVSTDSLIANAPKYYMLPMPNIAMGVWKILSGEREAGRAWLLPFMQMAITDAYGDDELEVQVVDYMTAKILIAFEDEAKAVSLLETMSLTGKPVFICQGRCGVIHDRWQTGYSCKVCLMDLCDRCVGILKQGNQLPINVCSPDHSWVYIQGLSTAPKPGEVYLNGEMIPKSQFYQHLKKDWQL